MGLRAVDLRKPFVSLERSHVSMKRPCVGPRTLACRPGRDHFSALSGFSVGLKGPQSVREGLQSERFLSRSEGSSVGLSRLMIGLKDSQLFREVLLLERRTICGHERALCA